MTELARRTTDIANSDVFTKTALILPDDITEDETVEVGKYLSKANDGVAWWLGDLGNSRTDHEWGDGQDFSEEIGFEYQYFRNCKYIAGVYELSSREDNLSYKHHEVAAPHDDRLELLAWCIETGASVAALRKEIMRRKRKDTEEPEFTGKYDVVVIDPPWPMEKIARDVRPNQHSFDYPTMEEHELAAMELPMADDCHVYMWTTHKFLPMALRLLEEWGVRYVMTMVWHKAGGFQPIGLPQYNCEFAIYGRVGTPKFVDTKAFNACFNAPRGDHSEKPEEFYEVIRRVTDGKRIDIFNRREIDGFDVWGNES